MRQSFLVPSLKNLKRWIVKMKNKPCIRWMSPLQGSKFWSLLRRAFPYAIECRPFRAETFPPRVRRALPHTYAHRGFVASRRDAPLGRKTPSPIPASRRDASTERAIPTGWRRFGIPFSTERNIPTGWQRTAIAGRPFRAEWESVEKMNTVSKDERRRTRDDLMSSIVTRHSSFETVNRVKTNKKFTNQN